ncbi:hypothetical protein [Halobacillus sp. K22]|uniref:hypothetical protein n=1 Tax=Halobacillus sp. K22 TaxID=3457431 RepID=UPI003FCDD10E
MSPGWVKTDLGGEKAKREPAQAMEGILWLALLNEDGPKTGSFFRDREELDLQGRKTNKGFSPRTESFIS